MPDAKGGFSLMHQRILRKEIDRPAHDFSKISSGELFGLPSDDGLHQLAGVHVGLFRQRPAEAFGGRELKGGAGARR